MRNVPWHWDPAVSGLGLDEEDIVGDVLAWSPFSNPNTLSALVFSLASRNVKRQNDELVFAIIDFPNPAGPMQRMLWPPIRANARPGRSAVLMALPVLR
jgi:hypothetical protein